MVAKLRNIVPATNLYTFCHVLQFSLCFCLDLRDIKDRYDWISPDEVTLTEKISKTVTGEVNIHKKC